MGLPFNRLVQSLTGSGLLFAPVAAPVGLGYTPAYTISRATTANVYTHSFNMDAVRPTATHTVYVGPGGSNAADGLSYANRVRSLKQGIVRANALGTSTSVVRLVVDPGVYRYSTVVSTVEDSFAGAQPTRDMIIEPSAPGRVVSIHDQAMPAFASVGSDVYASTYTTQTPARGACDLSRLDGQGFPEGLLNVSGTPANEAAIIAACNALASANSRGAVYQDVANLKLYVRMADGRAPDADLVVMSAPAGNGLRNLFFSPGYARNQVVWLDNVHLWGGYTLRSFQYAPDANPQLTIYSRDGSTMYGYEDGVHIDGFGTGVFLRHTTNYNYKDGFNYTASSVSSGAFKCSELQCTADWNGQDNNTGDASSNGSSAHNNCIVVRVGTTFSKTQNRGVHEIQASKSWNLGVISRDCRQSGAAQSANFASGYEPLTGETTEIWLDGCVSSGSTYDLQAYKGGKVYTRNMVTTGFNNVASGGGSISTY